MERVILHSDLNGFYASVECFYNPKIRHLPVSVCGSVDERHGIVLASNTLAKTFGVKTGEAIWQAKQKCKKLHIVSPHYERYHRHSNAARRIYHEYSPLVQAFGIDENWVDLTGTPLLKKKSGVEIAHEIRERIYYELGVTVSIGVSFNKTFAKLGSDMKKPNAVTAITNENYKNIVWPLPAQKLLYVGPSTTRELYKLGIHTIGGLAQADPELLKKRFGKRGYDLWRTANGIDYDLVTDKDYKPIPKTIGNSTTTPRDMNTIEDIRTTIMVLSDSVAERMRKQSFQCQTIQVSLRSTDLTYFQRQLKLNYPCTTSRTITSVAMAVIERNWDKTPLRSIGVRACDLLTNDYPQLSFLPDIKKEQAVESLESTVQSLRQRFGHFSVQSGNMVSQRDLSSLDTQNESSAQSVAFKR